MKKLIILITTLFGAQLIMAREVARFAAVAIDEVSGLPVPGVKVHANFEEYIGIRAWTDSPNPDSDVQITGADGSCKLKGKTNCGEVCCFVIDPTTNYYAGTGWGTHYQTKDLFGDWQPDNLVATIKLQRVEHPIPLFVKWVELRGPEKGLFKEDGPNGILKFDLMKGDWLPPYGNGVCADLTIESTKTVTGKDRKYRYATRRQEDVFFFDFHQKISVQSNDCLAVAKVDVTSGMKIRTGSDSGLGCNIMREIGTHKRIERLDGWYRDWHDNYDEQRCYTFRIRSKYDGNGNLTEAYYGKIYGDFELECKEDVGLASVRFMYYVNHNSLDRNLEWDRKNNLCPNPNRKQKPQP